MLKKEMRYFFIFALIHSNLFSQNIPHTKDSSLVHLLVPKGTLFLDKQYYSYGEDRASFGNIYLEKIVNEEIIKYKKLIRDKKIKSCIATYYHEKEKEVSENSTVYYNRNGDTIQYVRRWFEPTKDTIENSYYFYNEQNKLFKKTFYGLVEDIYPVWGHDTTIYNYDKNKKHIQTIRGVDNIILTYDDLGRLVSVFDTLYSKEYGMNGLQYKYDEKNKLVQIEIYNPTEETIFVGKEEININLTYDIPETIVQFEYDNKGRCIKEIERSYINNYDSYEKIFGYDDKDNLILVLGEYSEPEKRYYTHDNNLCAVENGNTLMLYVSDYKSGVVKVIQNEDNQLWSETRFFYDTDGNLIRILETNEKVDLVEEKLFEYKNGLKVMEKEFFNGKFKTMITYEYTFYE